MLCGTIFAYLPTRTLTAKIRAVTKRRSRPPGGRRPPRRGAADLSRAMLLPGATDLGAAARGLAG